MDGKVDFSTVSRAIFPMSDKLVRKGASARDNHSCFVINHQSSHGQAGKLNNIQPASFIITTHDQSRTPSKHGRIEHRSHARTLRRFAGLHNQGTHTALGPRLLGSSAISTPHLREQLTTPRAITCKFCAREDHAQLRGESRHTGVDAVEMPSVQTDGLKAFTKGSSADPWSVRRDLEAPASLQWVSGLRSGATAIEEPRNREGAVREESACKLTRFTRERGLSQDGKLITTDAHSSP
eukprot:1153901-Pelagomonas_calceolata.AAC.1